MLKKEKRNITFAANESEMSESFAAEAATKTEICLRMNSVQKQDKIFQLTHKSGGRLNPLQPFKLGQNLCNFFRDVDNVERNSLTVHIYNLGVLFVIVKAGQIFGILFIIQYVNTIA